MNFKTQCTKDSQDPTGLHHVTLIDQTTGHTLEFPSQTKFEVGEMYGVSITGKGIDKPVAPPQKPAVPAQLPAKPAVPGQPKPIDKFDAPPTR